MVSSLNRCIAALRSTEGNFTASASDQVIVPGLAEIQWRLDGFSSLNMGVMELVTREMGPGARIEVKNCWSKLTPSSSTMDRRHTTLFVLKAPLISNTYWSTKRFVLSRPFAFATACICIVVYMGWLILQELQAAYPDNGQQSPWVARLFL